MAMKNLEVVFDSELSFANHVIKVINNAIKMKGFLIKKINHFWFFTMLMSDAGLSIVRQSDLSQIYQQQKMEGVQREFVRYLHYNVTGVYPNIVPYDELVKTRIYEHSKHL